MRVLPSTHAFVFGAQQRSFIGLPRLQNGQLLCRPYVVRFDDIHRGFEYSRSLEGIVSKRKDSTYRSGRSPHWLKMKNPDAPAVTREAEEDWAR
jgi:hypothetical protein